MLAQLRILPSWRINLAYNVPHCYTVCINNVIVKGNFMKKTLLAIALSTGMTTSVYAATDIQNRVDGDAADALSMLEAQQKSTHALRVTLEDYVNFTQKLRQDLGDNVVIVDDSGEEVFKFEGQFLSKIELPFYKAENIMVSAIRDGKLGLVHFIKENVAVSKLDLSGVLALGHMSAEHPDVVKVLHDVMGVKVSKDGDQYLKLDLYAALGGQVDSTERVTYVSKGARAILNDYGSSKDVVITENGNAYSYRSPISDALIASGVNVQIVPSKEGVKHYDRIQKGASKIDYTKAVKIDKEWVW